MINKPKLYLGDRITVGATHELWIDGSKSWIKAEINAEIRPGETTTESFDRIGGLLADKIVGEIERQAKPIVDYNAAQRSSASQ